MVQFRLDLSKIKEVDQDILIENLTDQYHYLIHVDANQDERIIFNNLNISFRMPNNKSLSYFLEFINKVYSPERDEPLFKLINIGENELDITIDEFLNRQENNIKKSPCFYLEEAERHRAV